MTAMGRKRTLAGDFKRYVGDPAANVPQVLFGIAAVTTTSMIVDNFARAATLSDRWAEGRAAAISATIVTTGERVES